MTSVDQTVSAVDRPPRLSKNEQIVELLRQRKASRQTDPKSLHSGSSPNDDIVTFNVHSPAYPEHTVYIFPTDRDRSEARLQQLIDLVVADGLTFSSVAPPLKLVAFDMEWCHDWRAKRSRPVSLIQLGGQTKTLIVQLAHIQPYSLWSNLKLLDPLANFICSPHIIKFGVGVKSDQEKLLQDSFSFARSPNQKVWLNGYLELNDVVKQVDQEARTELNSNSTYSLQRLVCRYLEELLPKSHSLSVTNWESARLSQTQVSYAASDVVAAVRVCQKLLALASHKPNLVFPILYYDPTRNAQSRQKKPKTKRPYNHQKQDKRAQSEGSHGPSVN